MFLSTTLLSLSLGAATPIPVPATTSEDETASIAWVDGPLMNAVGKAKETDKPIFIYFWMNESEYCSKLYQETIVAPAVAKNLGDFVCYSANHSTALGANLVERFKIRTLPTMLFLSKEGKPEDSIAGFIPVDAFVEELHRIKRGENTLSDLETRHGKAMVGSEEDYDLRFRLAGKHQELGDQEKHDSILAAIREEDPKGRTPSGARAHLWHAQTLVYGDGDGDGDGDGYVAEGDGKSAADRLNLEPLYVHAKRMKLAEARFEAWGSIGNFEAQRGDMPACAKAFKTAWKYVPEEQAIDWSQGIASFLMDQAGEWTTSKDRKFVLDLARAGVKRAERLDPESELCQEQCGDQEYGHFVASKLYVLGRAYRFNDQQDKAVATLEKALALAPGEDLEAELVAWKSEG